jgi:hypothetical protein
VSEVDKDDGEVVKVDYSMLYEEVWMYYG